MADIILSVLMVFCTCMVSQLSSVSNKFNDVVSLHAVDTLQFYSKAFQNKLPMKFLQFRFPGERPRSRDPHRPHQRRRDVQLLPHVLHGGGRPSGRRQNRMLERQHGGVPTIFLKYLKKLENDVLGGLGRCVWSREPSRGGLRVWRSHVPRGLNGQNAFFFSLRSGK